MTEHKLDRFGNFLRVKTYRGSAKPSKMKQENVEKGHIIKLKAWNKRKGWFTYGYLFNIRDISVRREKTMRVIRALGVNEMDLKRMRL